MKILVAIAHHGTTNREHVLRLVAEYDAMRHDVDIVVLTEAAKELPAHVEQRIGVPTDDPWSLPFAYKPLFAERADRYDLFIYSEDDTLVTEAAIDAFCRATDELPEDLVAGFLRTEHQDGTTWCSSVHNHYRWDIDSTIAVGDDVYASFTNPHAACFLLTRKQLGAAIDSGGFHAPPRAGRFDMLVTAATDPYTQCGLTKVLPLTRFQDHLLPHLSNRYVGAMGTRLDDVMVQVDALIAAHHGGPATSLVDPEVRLDDSTWDRRYYAAADPELVHRVAQLGASVLVVGTGSGDLELALADQGADVTGIPLDDVIGALARHRGVRTTTANLDRALAELADERFDVVVLDDLLWRFTDPVRTLARLRGLLAPRGSAVITAPNLRRERVRAATGRTARSLPNELDHATHGVHEVDGEVLRSWCRDSGFRPDLEIELSAVHGPFWAGAAKPVTARKLVAVATNTPPSAPSLVGTAAPRVSVGMPVHDGARHLPEALDSILSQSLDDLEVIISDNASTDDTEEIAREAARRDPRVTYLRQPVNRGAAWNYNITFHRSTGRHFTWLAHDDARAPRFLERCLEEFHGPNPPVLVYTAARYVDGDGAFLDTDYDRIASDEPRPHRRLARVLGEISRVNSVFGLISSDALARTRLIGPFRASDLVLVAELAILGEIREVPEELATQRIHDAMSTHANRDADALLRWFDPAAGADPLGIQQRLAVEYVRSIRRLPLSPVDRAACLTVGIPTVGVREARTRVGRRRRDMTAALRRRAAHSDRRHTA